MESDRKELHVIRQGKDLKGNALNDKEVETRLKKLMESILH